MVHWLGALDALPEDLGLNPHDISQPSGIPVPQEFQSPFLASVGMRHVCGTQICMPAKHPYFEYTEETSLETNHTNKWSRKSVQRADAVY